MQKRTQLSVSSGLLEFPDRQMPVLINSASPRHFLYFGFLVIIRHLTSHKKNLIFVGIRGSLWRSTDSKNFGRVFAHFFVFLRLLGVLLCLQKLLNYHNNLAAVVLIHIRGCTEVHQTPFQSWFAYYDASTAHHPVPSLNIRYLAFFFVCF